MSGERSCSSGLSVKETTAELGNDGSHEVSPLNGRLRSNDGLHATGPELHYGGLNWRHTSTSNGLALDVRYHDPRSGKVGVVPDEVATSPSGSDVRKDEFWNALERCIAASTKGFIIGAGLRGGIALFAVLSRLKRRKRSLSGKTDTDAIKVALKETLRYGLFVGTFGGSFSIADSTIAAIGGRNRTAQWRSFVAGAIAGPSLLLTGHQLRHTSMAIYILMRALVLAARCGVKSRRMGWFFHPLTWKHGDTLLMCLSSSQILYAWIMHPKSLPSSYVAFLNKHAAKDLSIVQGIKALASRQGWPECLKAVKQHYNNPFVDAQLTSDMKIPCPIVHGDQVCEDHFFSYIGSAYIRSIPVYLPVYLVPALLVHRQGLFARPLPLLSKSLLGTARSSLFLATYCASAWLWTCWAFRLTGNCNPALVAAGTFPTGLAVLIEKKSRRMELALYCFSRAIESFAICLSDSGFLKQKHLLRLYRMDVILFSLATSIIMHCYAEERDVFRSKYLNVLDWVFGVPEPSKALTPGVEPKDASLKKMN